MTFKNPTCKTVFRSKHVYLKVLLNAVNSSEKSVNDKAAKKQCVILHDRTHNRRLVIDDVHNISKPQGKVA